MTWPPKGWIDQGACAASLPEADRLALLCRIARCLVGLKSTNPTYLSMILPWDTVYDAKQIGSGHHKCVLTCLGILRAFGCEFSFDAVPYKTLMSQMLRSRPEILKSPRPHLLSITTQVDILQSLPEWELTGDLPTPGEIYMIHNPNDERLLHSCTCVRREKDVIVSVDGGRPGVYRSKRRLRQGPLGLEFVDEKWTRYMLGILRTGRMIPTRNWLLPRRAP